MGRCKLSTWKQFVVISFLVVIRPASVQFAMPMLPPPPLAPPMFPPPPFAPPVVSVNARSNGGGNSAFALPIPVAMPMQIAVPAMPPPAFCAMRPRAPPCPPCPPCVCFPSCTPSFFTYCSSCHLKCRCTNGREPPMPLPPFPPLPALGPAFGLPMPMPPPPPIIGPPVPPGPPIGLPMLPPSIVVPVPSFPRRQMEQKNKDSSCSRQHEYSGKSSDESSDDDSSATADSDSSNDCFGSWTSKRCSRSKARRRRIGRKKMTFRKMNMPGDEKFIKPELSFVNNRGHIKLRHALNADDVRTLTQDIPERNSDIAQNVRMMDSNDAHRPRIVLESENLVGSDKTMRQQKRKHIFKNGRKELIFTPPANKAITNLSVSFRIA